jgi:hypothetical protein
MNTRARKQAASTAKDLDARSITVDCDEGRVTVPADTFIEGLRRRILTNEEPIFIIADELLYVHTLEAASNVIREDLEDKQFKRKA